MVGFFSKKETESLTRRDGKTYSCISCGLYKDCNSPKMKEKGNNKRRILNIIESPAGFEDDQNKHIKDQYATNVFKDNGIHIYNDCVNTFAVKCRPDSDKVEINKMNFNLDCCRIHLMRVIKKYKPQVIFVFGKNPLYSVIGSRWKSGIDSYNKWRGFVIPDQDLQCYIVPVHASWYAKEQPHLRKIFERDIQAGLSVLDKPFPVYKPPRITVLRKSLRRLLTIKSGVIAFDYETTGLKPHGKGHRIVCASVAVSADHVYVFLIPKEKEKRIPFIKLLKNTKVKKMAHNMKFEENWSVCRLNTKVKNWHWDSMIAAHLLDNRRGITGLKFQTYVQFGVMDYSSEVTPHLKGVDSKNANSHNKILKFMSRQDGEDKVLEYCALDSIFEYRLAMLQQDFIDNKILPF